MSNVKVTSTYARKVHSFFESLAFAMVFLLGSANISLLITRFLQTDRSWNNLGLGVSVLILSGLSMIILCFLVPFFTKIKSLTLECVLVEWILFIIAFFEIGRNIITGVWFLLLLWFSYNALRKEKYHNDEQVMHTRCYKIYQFLRSFAFVVVMFGCIIFVNQKFVFPKFITIPSHVEVAISYPNATFFKKELHEIIAHVKEHIQDFKYVIHRIALIGGIEGILLILLGFLSSIFSLGIELIMLGWLLIMTYVGLLLGFLYTVRYFIKYEMYTLAGLQTKMSLWYIYALDAAVFFVFLIILWFLVRVYIKRYTAREIAQGK